MPHVTHSSWRKLHMEALCPVFRQQVHSMGVVIFAFIPFPPTGCPFPAPFWVPFWFPVCFPAWFPFSPFCRCWFSDSHTCNCNLFIWSFKSFVVCFTPILILRNDFEDPGVPTQGRVRLLAQPEQNWQSSSGHQDPRPMPCGSDRLPARADFWYRSAATWLVSQELSERPPGGSTGKALAHCRTLRRSGRPETDRARPPGGGLLSDSSRLAN